MPSYGACTNMVLYSLTLSVNISWLHVIENRLEIYKCEHCLSHLLPPRKDNDIVLWPAGYDFLLPICSYELRKGSFVVRCLFNFLSCLTCTSTSLVHMLKSICNRNHVRLSLDNKICLLTYLHFPLLHKRRSTWFFRTCIFIAHFGKRSL